MSPIWVLDDLPVDLEAAGGELDLAGGLGLEAGLVLGEPRQQVRLADAGVPERLIAALTAAVFLPSESCNLAYVTIGGLFCGVD